MARDGQYRLLHSSISSSKRIRMIRKKYVKGDKWWRIGCHLLYTWLIKDEDDDRRLSGDPLWILANVVRYEGLTVEEIEEMLAELHRVKLIIWYEVNGDKFIQIVEKRDMQRIRKDRYKKSIYPAPPKGLLEEALGEEILVNSNGSEIATESQPNDNQVPADTQPSGCQLVDEMTTQSSSLSSSLSLSSSPSGIFDLWNTTVKHLSKIDSLSDGRINKIRTRLKEHPDIDWWRAIFIKADEVFIPPSKGHSKGWKPDFDWIIENDTNALKVMEGKYPTRESIPETGIDRATERLKEAIRERGQKGRGVS